MGWSEGTRLLRACPLKDTSGDRSRFCNRHAGALGGVQSRRLNLDRFPGLGKRLPGEARGGTGVREVASWPISTGQAGRAVAARVRAGLGVPGDAQARQGQWAQGGGGRAPRPGALGGERAVGRPDAAASREAHGGHGAGAGLEADVLVLLPVPAGHGALHAGALGADRLQYPMWPGLARTWRGARAGVWVLGARGGGTAEIGVWGAVEAP